MAPAGLLSPHGTVRQGDKRGRFDDVVGPGFMLIARSVETLNALGAAQKAVLTGLGARLVHMVAPGVSVSGATQDLDGKFLPWMANLGLEAMLVRPDFYLYGGVAQGAGVCSLVDDLADDLVRHGFQASLKPV